MLENEIYYEIILLYEKFNKDYIFFLTILIYKILSSYLVLFKNCFETENSE